MAVAFYIPDQATVLRKAREKEQQILRMRQLHWTFLASVIYDTLCKYVIDATNGGRTVPAMIKSQRKSSKCRKPSQ